MSSAIEDKRRKAQTYANEPGRFRFNSIEIVMTSEHGERVVSLENGVWHCTCPFYAEHDTCSHIIASQILLTSSGIDVPP